MTNDITFCADSKECMHEDCKRHLTNCFETYCSMAHFKELDNEKKFCKNFSGKWGGYNATNKR